MWRKSSIRSIHLKEERMVQSQRVAQTFCVIGALCCVIALSASPASAQRLIGAIGAGPGTTTLVELDPVTGALISTIGNVGYRINGMTWDATTGTLWATTSNNDATFPDGLMTIDLTTGAGTPIGSGAGQLVNNPAANSAGQVYGWTESGDDPVIWNTAAGTITVLGDSGVSSYEHGVAFDNFDTLYLFNQGVDVYTINTGDGSATLIGNVPVGGPGDAHHGDFHPVTNLYYGVDSLPEDGVTRNILVIDVGTLSVVNTIPTVDNLHMVTFVEDALLNLEVPVMGRYGIAALIFLMATVAVIAIRRQFA
jgi:hypothetical protein